VACGAAHGHEVVRVEVEPRLLDHAGLIDVTLDESIEGVDRRSFEPVGVPM